VRRPDRGQSRPDGASCQFRPVAIAAEVSEVNLPQMLGRQLLDRITIDWLPIDGSTVPFSQQSLIEQITHTVTPELWTTTFAVTPIGTEPFFILDSPPQGILDTNLLGF
jgi:hypothetical protein